MGLFVFLPSGVEACLSGGGIIFMISSRVGAYLRGLAYLKGGEAYSSETNLKNGPVSLEKIASSKCILILKKLCRLFWVIL